MTTTAENIRFLAWQGIALWGDGKGETDSNFYQLHPRAIDQPHLLTWLERKLDIYTSPQIQNELLTVMACTVVCSIGQAIREDQYYFIIHVADEVTDSSNKEQVAVCFRRVDNQFEAHEELIGLHQVDAVKRSSRVVVLKDTILRLNLAISNCRGQCYDGAANMAGIRNGVAVQMCAEEF